MASKETDQDEAIVQFCAVTGADEARAKYLLEACDWNLEIAVNMHVDTDDGRGSRQRIPASNSSAGPSTSNNDSDQNNTTAKTIDLADDDDDDDNEKDNSRDDDPEIIQTGRRRPQYARRSRPFPPDVDGVRAPIPPVRQVLVQNSANYDPSQLHTRRYNMRDGAGVAHVYDAFRDFQAEAQWQEMAHAAESSSASDAAGSSAPNAHKRTLQDLFRPPLEIMFRGSLNTAREAGTSENKWILVNIQDGGEFACQVLNRDLWSNQTVKDILKEHFIFWQVYHDSYEGSRYVQFYNARRLPHVSVLDPRTGEQMKSWPTTIDHTSFCDSIIEFLSDHPSPDGSSSDANTMKKLRVKEEDVATEAVSASSAAAASRTLYDESEEAQMAAAIQASLKEAENSSSSSKAFVDEDSYTDAMESDNDYTQSSTSLAHFSNSSSSTFNKCNENRNTSTNGQCSSVNMSASTSFSRSIKPDPGHRLKEDRGEILQEVEEVEDYTKYLGKDTEKFSDLVIRFPDGVRDQVKFPADSQLKALFLLLLSKGYGRTQYNYVTNFPRRLLHELPATDTLQDSKLTRETIFIERKLESDS